MKQNKKKMQSGSKKRKSASIKNIAMTTLGWELALPIFLGAFLGYQIDHNILDSGYKFTFFMLILGIIIGYYNIYKYIEIELLRTKLARKSQKDQK